MARTRSGEDLLNDSYRRADLVGATDRHPRDVVLRDVNQGGAELYDKLVVARGRAYYRATPSLITTLASTSRYALPPTFYRLISFRARGPGGFCLNPFSPQDEPGLREPGVVADKPTNYELQPGFVEMLPLHTAGTVIVCDYVPVFPDLLDTSASTFDGINGWETYIVEYAAREMFLRDGEKAEAQDCTDKMLALAVRIAGLAPKRDGFRAEKVKNVRRGSNAPMWGRRW